MSISLGNILIHRNDRGEDDPAIVTRVWSQSCVNVMVFPNCDEPYNSTSCEVLPEVWPSGFIPKARTVRHG